MLTHDQIQDEIEALDTLQSNIDARRSALETPLFNLIRALGDNSVGHRERLTSVWEGSNDLVIVTEATTGEWDTFQYRIPLPVLHSTDVEAAAREYRDDKLRKTNAIQLAQVEREIAALTARQQQLKGNPQ